MRRDGDPDKEGASRSGEASSRSSSPIADGQTHKNAMPFAMVITDPNLPDNPIVYVNKAFERITQYTADYAIGRNCRFLQGEETDERDLDKIRKGVSEGEDVSVDILNYRADGSTFVNRLLIAALPDSDGGIANFLGIQRVLAEDGSEPGREGDPMLEEAGNIVDAAKSDANTGNSMGDGERLTRIRSSIEDHISLIISLVRLSEDDDIKTLAPRTLGRRIEGLQLLYEELDQAGVVSVDDETVPLGAYLSRIAATLTHLEGRRSVRVNVDCDMAEVHVTEAARLGLLLSELLLNALRHAFPNRDAGLVNVEFKVLTSGRARLMVKDDGVGMGEEDDWPFTRDERAEDASEERTGHRVGAKLVRQLVEVLDALIDVRSDRFGTTVEVGLVLERHMARKPVAAR